jgi:glucose/arabinose dehydrogenase
MRLRRLAMMIAALAWGGCTEVDAPFGTIGARLPIELEVVAQGLDRPVFVTAAPGDDRRLFVVEQGGIVRVVRDGELLAEPFLDLTSLVLSGGEQGLLGLAFHPVYTFNGWFFVNYTDANGDTRIVRFTASDDPDRADPGSALEILWVDQPWPNHNGGMLAFGPGDGRLYIGLGDGGGVGDPGNHGQNPGTLLGSMLRIDVEQSTTGQPYRIPAGNPFVGVQDVRPETWAFGLRNPWRFSFDLLTGDLYIADVGDNAREEVSVQPGATAGGQNYGWPVMEGDRCFRPASGCNTTGLVRPVHTYGRDVGCAITGGYVYRGSAIPALQGRYLFADVCAGWIRSFVLEDGAASDLRNHAAELDAGGDIVSFGRDNQGELYVVAYDGDVFRIVPR